MISAMAAPLLEVVICTYNNAAALDATLSALSTQHGIDPAVWRCLVIDNNCTDQTREIVGRHRAAGLIPGLRTVWEPEQGLTAARIRGVHSSSSPWIAFVDDDCLLRSTWIAAAVSFAEEHPSIGAFGGRVILDWTAEPPAYARAYGYAFAEQDHGRSPKPVRFLAGAGLVASRAALSASGWIDGPLLADRVGTRLVSGGDVEIVLRIAAAGYALWYVPQCELLHRIPPRRTSLRYLIRITHGLGVSQSLADALLWDKSSIRWMAASARTLAQGMRALGWLVVAAARRKKAPADVAIQGSFELGRALGISRILLMPPSRRRELMGRARPSPKSPAPSPTKAA